MRSVAQTHGQEPEGDRAAGAGRPGRRPLGAGRLLRHARRARPQHEARVQAQPRALPVPEVGHAGVRHLQGRAAGHRHRAPGQPRVPRARRARVEGRRLLSRHARRHRLAHHDDQRHRRGRLGRGRHRGRGRHARPAGVLPHARRRRRAPQGRAAARRHRHRPRAHVTEMLRKAKVVGKFVEFFGEGAASLAVPDRATIANMAPEYGATMGFFPVDDKTVAYFRGTGRTDERDRRASRPTSRRRACSACRRRARSTTASRSSSTSRTRRRRRSPGPKRPQDRIDLGQASRRRSTSSSRSRSATAATARSPTTCASATRPATASTIGNGDVLIAAITSCTNTSNPGVLLAAGLLAKKAVERGLTVKPHVKTSLAPGSRVVTEYLTQGGPAALPRAARLLRRRLRLHDLHRQRRPARSQPIEEAIIEERPGVRRGALRQPQLRGAHPPEHPRELPRFARRWSSRSRSPARARST